MKGKICPKEVIKRAGLVLHKGQNMPNGNDQKGKTGAALRAEYAQRR